MAAASNCTHHFSLKILLLFHFLKQQILFCLLQQQLLGVALKHTHAEAHMPLHRPNHTVHTKNLRFAVHSPQRKHHSLRIYQDAYLQFHNNPEPGFSFRYILLAVIQAEFSPAPLERLL